MPEWDGLLPPVSCGERPIIDGVRTPVAYSNPRILDTGGTTVGTVVNFIVAPPTRCVLPFC